MPETVDTLSRRVDQLERRLDDLSSGLTRREPIRRDNERVCRQSGSEQRLNLLPETLKASIVMRKNIAGPSMPATFIRIVDVGIVQTLLADGWKVADG